MKKIFKYEITDETLADVVGIEMPLDHKILSAIKNPNEKFGIWIYALVDPNSEVCKENIYVVGTGHPADRIQNKAFIGTLQFDLPEGNFVIHLFCDPEAHINDDFYQEILKSISIRMEGLI
jgi:hypothetical protein